MLLQQKKNKTPDAGERDFLFYRYYANIFAILYIL